MAVEEPGLEPGSSRLAEEAGDGYHVNARHLLYPGCPVTRFPVPNEKVPWEVSAGRRLRVLPGPASGSLAEEPRHTQPQLSRQS